MTLMDTYKGQKGFTLVEVMVAIAVLTVGLLGAAAMQSDSVSRNALAVRTTKSATWAENTMERLMALPYTHADLQESANTPGAAGLNCGAELPGAPACVADHGPFVEGGTLSEVGATVQAGDFTVFWNVADNHPVFGCKTVRVIVRRGTSETWREPITMDFVKMGPI